MIYRISAIIVAILLSTALISAVSTSIASGANRFIVYEGSGDIFMRRSTDNGSTWKSPFNLSNNPGFSRVPSMAISGTNVYVAWLQSSVSSGDAFYTIFFRASLNNGASWGAKTDITQGMPNDSRGCDFGGEDGCPVDIAASGTNVYVSWFTHCHDNIDNNCLYFVASNNNGATWNKVQIFEGEIQNDIKLLATGNTVFMLDIGADIYVNKSTDGGKTWTNKTIPATGNCSTVYCVQFGL